MVRDIVLDAFQYVMYPNLNSYSPDFDWGKVRGVKVGELDHYIQPHIPNFIMTITPTYVEAHTRAMEGTEYENVGGFPYWDMGQGEYVQDHIFCRKLSCG